LPLAIRLAPLGCQRIKSNSCPQLAVESAELLDALRVMRENFTSKPEMAPKARLEREEAEKGGPRFVHAEFGYRVRRCLFQRELVDWDVK
jgi:hypothetical protein